MVCPKAGWTGLVCHTHQHYHRQWLPTQSGQIPGDEPEQGIDGYRGKDFSDSAWCCSNYKFLTGTARQLLFSVILSWSINLSSIYPFLLLETARHLPDGWRSVANYSQTMARLWVCLIYFPLHCVNVTNMSHHDHLSPLWRNIADIVVPDLAAPAKKTTDLFYYLY